MTMIDRQTREERRREQREGVEALEASGALDDLPGHAPVVWSWG